MSGDHYEDFLGDALAAILVRGRRHALVLGACAPATRLLADLDARGLDGVIRGIVDVDPAKRGLQLGRWKVAGPEEVVDSEFDLLLVAEDERKEQLLRAFASASASLPDVVLNGSAHFRFADERFEELLRGLLVKSTATGSPNTLVHLYQCLEFAAARGLEGYIVEFGMFRGGTTVLLAKMARKLGLHAQVIGFDTFAGFPPRRSLLDMYADSVCEFRDLEEVRRYCEPFGVEIVVGDISETYRRLDGLPLLLSFFDTDNYTPAHAALPLCREQTISGGAIVFDHYSSLHEFRYTLGERMAAQDALADAGFFNLHNTGVFLKWG
jgi:O-methyltransferase